MIQIVKKDEHIRLHRAAQDLRNAIKESGARMKKTACITMRGGAWRRQRDGIKIINQTLREIETETSCTQVLIKAGEATGYANAMENMGLMTEKELDAVIAVIGHTGEEAVERINMQKHVVTIIGKYFSGFNNRRNRP